MTKHRTRTELFVEVLNGIRNKGKRIKAELSEDVGTDYPLFERIVEHLVNTKLVKREYELNPEVPYYEPTPKRQKEILSILPAADNETMVIKSLGKFLAPDLSECMDEWTERKLLQQASPSAVQSAKDISRSKTFSLFRRLFKDQEEIA